LKLRAVIETAEKRVSRPTRARGLKQRITGK